MSHSVRAPPYLLQNLLLIKNSRYKFVSLVKRYETDISEYGLCKLDL